MHALWRMLLIATLAAPPAPDGSRTTKPAARPPRNLALRALRQPVSRAEFDGMSLEDFVEWLERTSKANVVVRWPLLESAGVSREAPIHLKLHDVTLGQVLTHVLEQISPREMPLAYQAIENVLTISTKDDLNRKMIVRTYEVRYLVMRVPQFEGLRMNVEDVGRGGRRGAGLGPMVSPAGGSGGAVSAADDTRLDESVRNLIRVIESTVKPESWRVNGGPGTIAFFQGKLIVRNSAEVHEILGGSLLKR